MIGIVKVQFELSSDDKNIQYAKKISLLNILDNHNTCQQEINYPTMIMASEKKGNLQNRVHFDIGNSVKFINIICETTNTELGE